MNKNSSSAQEIVLPKGICYLCFPKTKKIIKNRSNLFNQNLPIPKLLQQK